METEWRRIGKVARGEASGAYRAFYISGGPFAGLKAVVHSLPRSILIINISSFNFENFNCGAQGGRALPSSVYFNN